MQHLLDLILVPIQKEMKIRPTKKEMIVICTALERLRNQLLILCSPGKIKINGD